MNLLIMVPKGEHLLFLIFFINNKIYIIKIHQKFYKKIEGSYLDRAHIR